MESDEERKIEVGDDSHAHYTVHPAAPALLRTKFRSLKKDIAAYARVCTVVGDIRVEGINRVSRASSHYSCSSAVPPLPSMPAPRAFRRGGIAARRLVLQDDVEGVDDACACLSAHVVIGKVGRGLLSGTYQECSPGW